MTTWNNTAPAVGNQISADIPDITENFAHLKSGFVRIFQDTWSDSDLTDDKIDTAVGFNDGTYNYEFPTEGIGAHSVIMLGTSDTIVWMYLNAAPPGWKVLSTGADSLLAVSGGTAAYNVNGGNGGTGDTWTQPNHTHTMGTHLHQWYNYVSGSSADQSYNSVGSAINVAIVTESGGALRAETGSAPGPDQDYYTTAVDPGDTANGATANTWRPLASVGKLFQLNTA